MEQLSPHAAANRRHWDAQADTYQSLHGAQLAASGGSAWGSWQQPEAELDVLGEVAGRDVLELGCGAAQWSIALHGRGARVTALDLSERQLEHARELMQATGARFELVCASAEATPFADRSFDVVFCDWGAMTFADPYRTVPEVARLLRAGGRFAFLTGTPIADCAWPSGADHPRQELVGDYFGMRVLPEPDGSVIFQLPYGEWIELLRVNGFEIEALIELRPEPDAPSSYRDESDRAWARRWPMEHIWKLRRAG
jgi:SAM-dependent methyltransferase